MAELEIIQKATQQAMGKGHSANLSNEQWEIYSQLVEKCMTGSVDGFQVHVSLRNAGVSEESAFFMSAFCFDVAACIRKMRDSNG